MKIQLVGIQKQDYKLDNGYSFKGVKLHCVDLDSSDSNLVGNVVVNLKIADSSPFSDVPLNVGANYVAYFNQKGGLDYFKQDK